LSHVLLFAFLACLVFGVYSDVAARRVKNELVAGIMVIGFVAALVGNVSVAASFLSAVFAVLLGLAIWLPFWIAGLLGAGDVKFFAAGSAWLGPALTWRAAVVAALLGGVLSLVVIARRSGLRGATEMVAIQTAQARSIIANADIAGSSAASRTFPYALPMALAIAFAALAPSRVLEFLGP
jgi:prepilin peptidase CpaA